MQLPENDWFQALKDEFEQPYFKALDSFVESAYTECQVFPAKHAIFSALDHTPLGTVKVLLLGQDPYHDDNQAHGLSFSVLPGQKIPPSLLNIYKELEADLGYDIPHHGYLIKWAEQGVLLLNTVLTVSAHEANSHKNRGWEQFTDAVIRVINEQNRPIVIFLWGKPAQKKRTLLNNPHHLVLEAPHPSPLSSYRGFFGSKPFSQANTFLREHGLAPIQWNL